MPREQQIEIESANGLERLALPGQVHSEPGRPFRQHFPIVPEDISGKERPGRFIEQTDAARSMARNSNAGEAVDSIPVFQEHIRCKEPRFQDCPHDAEKKTHNTRVNRQGKCPGNIPCIGLADCYLCSRGSILQCHNSSDMVHMEVGDDDCPDVLRFPVQLFPDIGKDLLPAAQDAGIDDDQAVADKDVAVPIDAVDLVYARYYLHDLTDSEYRSPGLSSFPAAILGRFRTGLAWSGEIRSDGKIKVIPDEKPLKPAADGEKRKRGRPRKVKTNEKIGSVENLSKTSCTDDRKS